MSGRKHHQRLAEIVFFDPGQTTGVAVLAIDPAWLAGAGDADWSGLRRAIKYSWLAQIGEDACEWDDGHKIGGSVSPDYTRALPFNGPEISTAARIEMNMIYEARDILEYWPAACWGYEDYVPESMAAAQKGALTPMRFFATLAFNTIMDAQRMRVPIVQSRTMKSSANDDRMKRAGLYLPGMRHATDAARHAAVFLRNARQKSEVRETAWPRLFDPRRAPTRGTQPRQASA